MPIFEENRVIKQMVLDDLDPNLPVGSPVEVELAIDVKHDIEVRIRVRQGANDVRTATAAIEPAPPPRGRPAPTSMRCCAASTSCWPSSAAPSERR